MGGWRKNGAGMFVGFRYIYYLCSTLFGRREAEALCFFLQHLPKAVGYKEE